MIKWNADQSSAVGEGRNWGGWGGVAGSREETRGCLHLILGLGRVRNPLANSDLLVTSFLLSHKSKACPEPLAPVVRCASLPPSQKLWHLVPLCSASLAVGSSHTSFWWSSGAEPVSEWCAASIVAHSNEKHPRPTWSKLYPFLAFFPSKMESHSVFTCVLLSAQNYCQWKWASTHSQRT